MPKDPTTGTGELREDILEQKKAHCLTDYAVKQELTLLFPDETERVFQLLSISGPNHL